MAIYDAKIVDITPFGEEWKSPYDGNSLFDTNIYSQLIRGYNHLNKEIGVDLPCGLSYKPNDYIKFNGLSAFPTASALAGVAEVNVPQGQYINYCIKILRDLYNELNGFCNYFSYVDKTGSLVISSVYGFNLIEDKYWNLYDPDYDSTSSSYRISLNEIIDDVDANLFNNSTTPIIESAFNIKSNWGNIIKILQRGQELFKKKKSRAYTKSIARFDIEYINNSSEYPFENFSYIQKTGEYITSTNVLNLDDDDGYIFPGNNSHNYCPSQKTQYSNYDILNLPSWEEDIYAYNIFRSGENNANGAFLSRSDNWAVSGFDSQAGDYHPLGSTMLFFTQYSLNNSDPTPPCTASRIYETGYIYLWYEKMFLKNMGWFKLAGSKRKYKIKIIINGLSFFDNQAPIATFKVEPIFTVYPTVAGRSITTTGNEVEIYNSVQTHTMSITAQLTGDAYLTQPILPLPTPSVPRTYGARINLSKFKYYINGHELVDNFGNPRITFYVYTSPCGKIIIDNESLNS